MKVNSFLLFLLTTWSVNARQTIPANESHSLKVNPALAPFYHGVASGDPLSDRVILWTRVTPPSGNIDSIDVQWQIATDPSFLNVVNFGKVKTNASRDYTVKLDVCGLAPSSYYYYVFRAYGKNSIVGRTKTAPIGNNDSLKFGVVSCANYEGGYYNAYEQLSNRNDLDAIIHLGDYIYEYEVGGFSANVAGRENEPVNEIISLSDYRTRHSHYKLDPQLRYLHQQYPFITVWDDHETANDSYKDGADNHTPATEGSWQLRKNIGRKVYNEWMPIRASNDSTIYRVFKYGNLASLIFMDTRLEGRDKQVAVGSADASNPNRHIISPTQMNWVKTQLADTTTKWKILCQQVMVAPVLVFGQAVIMDQWDGYVADRNNLFDYIKNNIPNVVVLTGDIHTAWANDVPGAGYNGSTGANSRCVEFVGTSVSSQNFNLPIPASLIKTLNAHIKYVDLSTHGYMLFSITKQKAQNDWINTTDITKINLQESNGESWYVNAGERRLRKAGSPMPTFSNNVARPSRNPNHLINVSAIEKVMYFPIIKNTTKSGCLYNASSPCPSINVQNIDSPKFGLFYLINQCFTYQPKVNYLGKDTARVAVCRHGICDTVALFMEVLGRTKTDSMYVQIGYYDTSFCFTLNDLSGNLISSTIAYDTTILSAQSINSSCINLRSKSILNKNTVLYYVGCDNTIPAICDTVMLFIKIRPTATTSFYYAKIRQDSSLNLCINIDDIAKPYNTNLLFHPEKAFVSVFDTCINYKAKTSFIGKDTLTYIACQNIINAVCDTAIIYIQVDSAQSKQDTIKQSNIDFVEEGIIVFSAHPNPVIQELLIQYYVFSDQEVSIELTNLLGQTKYTTQLRYEVPGIKYTKLYLRDLPKGIYQLNIVQTGKKWTKLISKE